MKVFVFAWDRYDTISTSPALEAEGIDHTVLVHTDEHRDRFVAGGRVRPERLHVTGQPKGLAYNRNAALDLMQDGEWAVFLVDDLLQVYELDGYDELATAGAIPIDMANQREWARRFKTEVPLRQFMHRCAQATTHADTYGAHLVGFAGYDNALYRSRRWKLNTLADGRAWVIRKTHLRFDENVQLIDDVCWTAQNILAFGSVLVDAWILPLCKRYTEGAFGTITQRLDQKRREVSYLVRTYPQLCATRRKAGWPDGTHVVIRNVRQWG